MLLYQHHHVCSWPSVWAFQGYGNLYDHKLGLLQVDRAILLSSQFFPSKPVPKWACTSIDLSHGVLRGVGKGMESRPNAFRRTSNNVMMQSQVKSDTQRSNNGQKNKNNHRIYVCYAVNEFVIDKRRGQPPICELSGMTGKEMRRMGVCRWKCNAHMQCADMPYADRDAHEMGSSSLLLTYGQSNCMSD